MAAEFFNDSLDAERSIGRTEGRMDERARLRPLLERCLMELKHKTYLWDAAGQALLADLRHELGIPEEG